MERELYRLAAHELAAAQQQMVLLGRKTAAERVASFLIVLAERLERTGDEPARFIDLPMRRSDIADYLGLTKETISRVLALLKGRRLIRLDALDRIEVLDRDSSGEHRGRKPQQLAKRSGQKDHSACSQSLRVSAPKLFALYLAYLSKMPMRPSFTPAEASHSVPYSMLPRALSN
jgi:hypothetical protein